MQGVCATCARDLHPPEFRDPTACADERNNKQTKQMEKVRQLAIRMQAMGALAYIKFLFLKLSAFDNTFHFNLTL